MTRPRLHWTPEEKMEAARRSCKKYYDRNHAIISLKDKASINVDSQKIPKQRVKLCAGRSGTLANVDAALNRLMNGSSTELFDNLVHNFKVSTDIKSCIQAITTLLVKVEELQQQVQECHRATLQHLGVGKELRQVELTAGRVDDVNKALEDVLMHAMDDIHSLLYHHARGELLYKKTPDFAVL
ncbi:uncharacterized protein F5891DRAFT_1190648 [Suillus fuscotomentosus]|uniref:Uncharacterized protein n=1 Tax=Suillus fuscotomentosus TaxID=1912939 RepID=A0AAD4HJ70_9AGAM|nr:uncharacterized protein F5891DRAFT_1190648 [Suillus fuscotomentosus]KAG1898573.1 hypothetical protein F5891DRAFT_1190648 [Suillus fuscotomentosus]